MRNLILGVFALLMTVAVSAQSYSYFDNDVRFYNDDAVALDGTPMDGAVVTLTHFGQFGITENFGFTDYASIEGNDNTTTQYGQVLLGVYYNFGKLTAYAYAGKESISNKVRFGYMLYYTTGDKFKAYVFYQRNGRPDDSNTSDSEWYDLLAQYALVSKDKNSVYVGARLMTNYGLGPVVSVRQAMSPTTDAIVGFTMYNDVAGEYSDGDWTPTLTVAFQFN